MKILFVSMPSVHVTRWIENLKDTEHELFWFDILNRGKLDTLHSVIQFTGWKKRKLSYIKGEYQLQKHFPMLYEKIQSLLEVTTNEALEKVILDIQPDIVHSFELHSCCTPILATMQKYSNLKWLYSCWGTDLYYYQQFSKYIKKINEVLQRVNFLHTDCERDFTFAKQLGFTGKHVGVIPGGTGYKLQELEVFKLSFNERKIILVKGYEHHFGRGLNVVKALHGLQKEIQEFDVVVFGAHPVVIDYIKSNDLHFTFFDRHELTHHKLMELMGKSLLYIGNSISDGMANTLLEAIVMGAFPIQSNPGGVTEEIIQDGVNGFLIIDPESLLEIKEKISSILKDFDLIKTATLINEKIALDKLNYANNKVKVINIYKSLCE
jgi:glycosyltransferase involved in cell wall biosynthesis